MVSATLADYVRAIRVTLPGELIPEPAVDRIVAIADRLPVCPLAGFECRLGPQDTTVDLQVELPGRVLLPSVGSPDLGEAERYLRSACGTWIEQTTLIDAAVDAAGCEFDLGRVEDAQPGVFLALSAATEKEPSLLVAAADALMSGMPRPVQESLHRCIASLPADARIRFIGALPARNENVLRVNVYGVPPSDIPSFLRSTGWPCPTDPVERLLGVVQPLTDVVVVCLDLAETVLPRVGFECILEKQPSTEERWSQLLEQLVAAGVCSPAKRAALLQWEGVVTRRSAPEQWPPDLEWGDRVLGGDVSAIHLYLSHVKLVHVPGRELEAKAYLGFFHRWSPLQERIDAGGVVDGLAR